MLSHSNQPVPRKLFHAGDLEDATGPDCGSIESDVCNQSLASSQLRTSSAKLDSVCKHVLQGVFTGKDIQALSAKATQLVEEGSIRDGFDSQSTHCEEVSFWDVCL